MTTESGETTEGLPPLPQCTYLVSTEAKQHGMYPAYRSLQNVMKYGGQETFEMMFSRGQMLAYATAALPKAGGAEPEELIQSLMDDADNYLRNALATPQPNAEPPND